MRPTCHRLHLAPELDDLGLYAWPVALNPGDTLTTEDGRRFKVVAVVLLDAGGAVVRLAEVGLVREVPRLIRGRCLAT